MSESCLCGVTASHNPVPVFSDGFSEGRTRNIDEGFPSNSDPYADDYDYLSDSDLEDESPFPTGNEGDGLESLRNPQGFGTHTPSAMTSGEQPQSSQDITSGEDDHL